MSVGDSTPVTIRKMFCGRRHSNPTQVNHKAGTNHSTGVPTLLTTGRFLPIQETTSCSTDAAGTRTISVTGSSIIPDHQVTARETTTNQALPAKLRPSHRIGGLTPR